jgi:hypothetical protein
MKRFGAIFTGALVLGVAAVSEDAVAGNAEGRWQPLKHQPTFVAYSSDGTQSAPGGATTQLLLTDGSVLVQNFGNTFGTPEVWKLTPDRFGSYVNGTWSQLASFPAGYAPYACASAVLPDGRVIFEGGEYNGVDIIFAATNLGAIYDPVADAWTPVSPPAFFDLNSNIAGLFVAFGEPIPTPNPISDASSVVLPDGTFMLAASESNEAALLDPYTLTWTQTGFGKVGNNHEEGWTLLPNGKVLTVDLYVGTTYPSDPTGSEVYDPATGDWSGAGSTIVPLGDAIYLNGVGGSGSYPYPDREIGPAILRPDGKVVAFGGAATGVNSIYDSTTGLWAQGPTFPTFKGQQMSAPDGPAALLPNGNILVCAGAYDDVNGNNPPTKFFELTYGDLTLVSEPAPPNASKEDTSFFEFLVLPTGQIMETDGSNDVEIYTPADTSYDPAWVPVITDAPAVVKAGSSYLIHGIGFNGMSQASAFGDDYQSATNYPLVRITNLKTGHVFYARTHDHSSMAVASKAPVHTTFDVSPMQETGRSKLEVVANGIPSTPVFVQVE